MNTVATKQTWISDLERQAERLDLYQADEYRWGKYGQLVANLHQIGVIDRFQLVDVHQHGSAHTVIDIDGQRLRMAHGEGDTPIREIATAGQHFIYGIAKFSARRRPKIIEDALAIGDDVLGVTWEHSDVIRPVLRHRSLSIMRDRPRPWEVEAERAEFAERVQTLIIDAIPDLELPEL